MATSKEFNGTLGQQLQVLRLKRLVFQYISLPLISPCRMTIADTNI
jgi:hypothetical protein